VDELRRRWRRLSWVPQGGEDATVVIPPPCAKDVDQRLRTTSRPSSQVVAYDDAQAGDRADGDLLVGADFQAAALEMQELSSKKLTLEAAGVEECVRAAEKRREPGTWEYITFCQLQDRYCGVYGESALRRFWQEHCIAERRYDEDWAAVDWLQFYAKNAPVRGGAKASSAAQTSTQDLRRRWRWLPVVEEDDDAIGTWVEPVESPRGQQLQSREEGPLWHQQQLIPTPIQKSAVTAGAQAVQRILERPACRHTGPPDSAPDPQAAEDWLTSWERAAVLDGFS